MLYNNISTANFSELILNPFKTHNHKTCIKTAFINAEHICAQHNLRFTAIRRDVFSVIWGSHQPITAYDILRELRTNKPNAEPPTVYRALEFLLENDLIHRIESLNAYIGCDHIGNVHRCQFLICCHCHKAVELSCENSINQAIFSEAEEYQFKIDKQIIEIQGTCKQCQ